jgi:hypothetical protein
VVRGAVVRGLEGNNIATKRCRRHYGVGFSHPYDPKQQKDFDENLRHVWRDEFTNRDMLTGYMTWGVVKVRPTNSVMVLPNRAKTLCSLRILKSTRKQILPLRDGIV